MIPLAQTLLETARAKGLHIATAESCTGGLISAAITDIAGSSDVFDRGFVTYSNIAKSDLLGVSPDTIARHGAVSEETAAEMVAGALAHSAADLAVAVTGVAGPGASGSKPEGRVCFGVMMRGGAPTTETHDFGALGRAAVRKATVAHALNLLIKRLDAAR
ncbi:MAG: CinA family protein [Rhodobacteraceae bacterium]|jgi:nicotinamide-nucleotide amidase|nr:CinA family protein [Paracoccaceae bacterium]